MRKGIVLVVLLAVSLLAGPSPTIGAPPPLIRVVDLKGLDTTLAQYRGKAVLLNFWAIWCQPCVAELPEFLEVGREFRDRNAVVVTVSYDLMIPDVTKDGVMKQMQAFLTERKFDMPVLIYDAPDYDAINKRFGLPGPVPATVAIDAKGAIVDRQSGKSGKARFESMMAKALGG
jgi:thiol-disulfide isomerase/thioredoxin